MSEIRIGDDEISFLPDSRSGQPLLPIFGSPRSRYALAALSLTIAGLLKLNLPQTAWNELMPSTAPSHRAAVLQPEPASSKALARYRVGWTDYTMLWPSDLKSMIVGDTYGDYCPVSPDSCLDLAIWDYNTKTNGHFPKDNNLGDHSKFLKGAHTFRSFDLEHNYRVVVSRPDHFSKYGGIYPTYFEYIVSLYKDKGKTPELDLVVNYDSMSHIPQDKVDELVNLARTIEPR